MSVVPAVKVDATEKILPSQWLLKGRFFWMLPEVVNMDDMVFIFYVKVIHNEAEGYRAVKVLE